LLKIYAHCIDGQADAANQRITDALGTRDTQPEPGDEEDGEGEWQLERRRSKATKAQIGA
jgi:hypothetical protein